MQGVLKVEVWGVCGQLCCPQTPQKTFFAATCPVLITGLGGSQLQICAGLSDFKKTLSFMTEALRWREILGIVLLVG
jgi:hypothetical protein